MWERDKRKVFQMGCAEIYRNYETTMLVGVSIILMAVLILVFLGVLIIL